MEVAAVKGNHTRGPKKCGSCMIGGTKLKVSAQNHLPHAKGRILLPGILWLNAS